MLSAYVANKGDIFKIIDSVPCSELEDLDRFHDMIQAAIDAGEVQEYAKFKKVPARELKKRQKAAQSEAKQAEKALAELKAKNHAESDENLDADAELKAMIQQKNKSRMESLVSSLEANYTDQKKKSGASSKKRKKAAEPEMPTEEEFQALQEKMAKKSKASSKTGKFPWLNTECAKQNQRMGNDGRDQYNGCIGI